MQKRPDINDTLVRSITELRALERYTLEALELQQHEDDLQDHESAAQIIEQTVEILRYHIGELDLQISIRGRSNEPLRVATTSMAGAFLGFLSKTRSHDTSKMLRDDYTLLSLASIGYVMLHTTSLALRQTELAAIAMQHHRDLASVVEKIALTLPHLVLQDLSGHFEGLNQTAADATVQFTENTLIPDTPWAALA